MYRIFTLTIVAVMATVAVAEDNKPIEFAGMKSTPPADWKQDANPKVMRYGQYQLPKADGDKEGAELALFVFDTFAGSVEDNLKRQLNKFAEEGRKDKNEKIKLGSLEVTYQDVSGTFLKKAFPMAKDATKVENFRQLYVIAETKDGKQWYMTLLGPKDTVEKHKKGFEEFLKKFK